MDEEFRLSRLAAIYDVLEPDRCDLDLYVAVLAGLGVERVLDIGCGTGVLALRLAARGCDVVGVDPAGASLDVARRKPGADAVRWVLGDATAAGVTDRDAAVMTANVAMAVHDDDAWAATLSGARMALRPGGRLVFETRRPDARAWQGWTPDRTTAVTALPGGDTVRTWVEVTDVAEALVRIRWTFVFSSDEVTLTSESVLRYRCVAELDGDLARHGFTIDEVRDAPDRPGLEYVVLAHRE